MEGVEFQGFEIGKSLERGHDDGLGLSSVGFVRNPAKAFAESGVDLDRS